jgi:pimeloyl-ACP methyl ester carboxylesterase
MRLLRVSFAALASLVAGVAIHAAPAPAQVPEAPRGTGALMPADRVVTVNGLRIHYLDWGTAGRPPLILLHGLDRIAHTFDHLAPHFAGRYHVIAMDMRGHGDSGWDPDGRYGVEDYARDVGGLAEQLELRGVVVWGNSTGGRVAQVFAGMRPDLVAGVIAEDVGPERPRTIADSYARRVQEEQQGWASEDELLDRLRRTSQGMPDAGLRTYVRFGTTRRPDGRVIWKRDPNIAGSFTSIDLWPFVRRIGAPVLYLLGGRSAIVPVATQEELRQTLPRAQLVTVPDTGHYPSDEKPEEVLAIVDRFLAEAVAR